MTNTTFAQRQWIETGNDQNEHHYSKNEQLEDACWNGMLYDMLPGIIAKSPTGKQLFLWQMKQKSLGLEMELGEFPPTIERYFSIDPQYFLPEKSYN